MVTRGGQPGAATLVAILVIWAEVNVVQLKVIFDVGTDGLDSQIRLHSAMRNAE